jgi:nitronate monooxygenase
MSLLPFLTGVVERYPDIPVLAAGGIGDGRTLAAALTAGADGAWLGTAFLATSEAVEVHDIRKHLVVESDGGDTVFTRAFDIASGMPWPAPIGGRLRRHHFTDEWSEREAELREKTAASAASAVPSSDDPDEAPDPEASAMYYGQSARFVTGIRPAADVVRSMSEEAERILRSRPQALLR